MQIPLNIRKLVEDVLGSSGVAPAGLRKAAFEGNTTSMGEPLRVYLNKTLNHAYKIVDRDVDALRAAGYDDDQIFELTICAAVGAGFSRLQRGLAALEEA